VQRLLQEGRLHETLFFAVGNKTINLYSLSFATLLATLLAILLATYLHHIFILDSCLSLLIILMFLPITSFIAIVFYEIC